ncbi:hypothetical protein Tco_1350106 [Tanacetum coccineum]
MTDTITKLIVKEVLEKVVATSDSWMQEYGGQVNGTIRSPPEAYLMDSRHNDKRINQMSKSTLCHAWVYGWGNDESTDDIVSSNEEWEESDYGNPPNTNDDSFLEPYLDAHNKNTK